jgi:hypothetical protein
MSPLARSLVEELQQRPRHFGELVEAHLNTPWAQFLRAWGELRAADVLGRDDDGRYVISSKGATHGRAPSGATAPSETSPRTR